ncbi:MAG: molybdenum cofactor biosynthesis protein MoaE [Gemmatimonadetes bacterium]|nr:molybdenum cofactor biosynthesis protein MoaE [Gemmatimonadota bacterium]
MHVSLTQSPIDPSAVLELVGSPADGAVLLFLGTVREQNQGQPVSGLRYEAYEKMAEDVLRAIVEEAAGKLGTRRIAVVHRTGELAIGDVSVAIAVSSPHRAEAFDACRYLIEELKVRLPIWKHEQYVDGEARWLEGKAPPMPQSAGP